MKKIYFLVVVVLTLTFPSFGQGTARITRIMDGVSNADCTGSVAGGRPKMVEIYVDGTIDFGAVNDNGTPGDDADDIKYHFDVMTNGAVEGTWNEKTIETIGVVTDDFFYLINDAGGSGSFVFNSMYPGTHNEKWLGIWMNGNDPVRLVDPDGVVLDQFGDPSDVSAGDDYDNPWNYQKGFAARLDGSASNAGAFDESNWTFTTGWVNETCGEMATLLQFGTYEQSVASIGKNEIENFTMYPNPVVNGEFRINSGTLGNVQKSVQIYSMLGKQVYNNSKSFNDQAIDVSNLTSGIYTLKVEENGKLATRKLIIE